MDCVHCGKNISARGRYQHYMKHVREGVMQRFLPRPHSKWAFRLLDYENSALKKKLEKAVSDG